MTVGVRAAAGHALARFQDRRWTAEGGTWHRIVTPLSLDGGTVPNPLPPKGARVNK
jgi:hypothetical protein